MLIIELIPSILLIASGSNSVNLTTRAFNWKYIG